MTSSTDPSAEPICLLDDDPAVLKSIQRLLACDGFAVRTFSRSNSFLDYASEHPVKLAIVDIWVEEMNGLELQTKLSTFSPRTRVIIMTGSVDPATKEAALKGGATAFFTKPFDDAEFLAAVRNVIDEGKDVG